MPKVFENQHNKNKKTNLKLIKLVFFKINCLSSRTVNHRDPLL